MEGRENGRSQRDPGHKRETTESTTLGLQSHRLNCQPESMRGMHICSSCAAGSSCGTPKAGARTVSDPIACLWIPFLNWTTLSSILEEDVTSFITTWHAKDGWYPWEAFLLWEERGMRWMGEVGGERERMGEEGRGDLYYFDLSCCVVKTPWCVSLVLWSPMILTCV